MARPYRGICACCGLSYYNKKFKSNQRGFSIPLSVALIDLKYFSADSNRLCNACKTSLSKPKNSFKQITLNENTTKIFSSSISSTNQNNQENIKILFN